MKRGVGRPPLAAGGRESRGMKNGLRMKSEKREEEKQERGVEWSEMVQGAKTRQQGWADAERRAGREECSHGGPCGAQRGSDEDSDMEDERGTEKE